MTKKILIYIQKLKENLITANIKIYINAIKTNECINNKIFSRTFFNIDYIT